MKRGVIPFVALLFSSSIALRGAVVSGVLCGAAVIRGQSLDGTSIPEITVPAPEGTNRVTASAIIQPAVGSPGDAVTVTVKVRIAPGHWIYALENSGSRNQPTALEMQNDSRSLRPAGRWQSSEPKTKGDGSRIYSSEAIFQRRFLIESTAKETTGKVPITIKYQICNEALCWPPATLSVEPVLNVVRSP